MDDIRERSYNIACCVFCDPIPCGILPETVLCFFSILIWVRVFEENGSIFLWIMDNKCVKCWDCNVKTFGQDFLFESVSVVHPIGAQIRLPKLIYLEEYFVEVKFLQFLVGISCCDLISA